MHHASILSYFSSIPLSCLACILFVLVLVTFLNCATCLRVDKMQGIDILALSIDVSMQLASSACFPKFFQLWTMFILKSATGLK